MNASPKKRVRSDSDESIISNEVLSGIRLEEKVFLKLLGDMMSHGEKLVNNPPLQIPEERLAADIVLEYLRPYTAPNGPLEVKVVEYQENRTNLIIKYAGKTNKWVSFVGSHLDLVPADASVWKRDPFTLTQEGDMLYGRGVSDCLGHVAILANIFKQLGETKPELEVGVACVLIANEEQSSIMGIGVDQLAKDGELDFLKSGPLYWLDVANFGPVMGSGGMVTWQLHSKGKKAHSGFPTQGINPISMGYECVRFIEERFYKDFPASLECKAYKYKHGSTFKPTAISSPEGSLSQIPDECHIKGDIRMVPFEDVNAVLAAVEGYVKDFNKQITDVSMPGPAGFESDGQKGEVELTWLGQPTEGIACKLTSVGYQAILQATNDVRGEAKPFSLTGTLPLVREMQKAGYDVQLIGYGRMEGYHAVNEFGLLSEFVQGAEIIVRVIDYLNQTKRFKSDSSDDEQ